MKDCLISFIVPVYNAEKYLDDCLMSILNQTNSNFEVLIVNDGSTDGSAVICNKYAKKDRRVTVFHTENHGVAHARNKAIKLAIGKYILFVDSDDVVHPQLAEQVIQNFALHRGAEMLCWKVTKFTSNENRWKPINIQKLKPKIRTVSEMVCCVIDDAEVAGYSCNKAFLKTVIDGQVFFQENIAILEDMLFICEYLKCCNPKNIVPFIDCELYGYRQVQTSVLHSPFSEKQLTSLLARDRVLEILEEMHISSDRINKFRNRLLCALCIMHKKLIQYKGENKDYWQNTIDMLWSKHRGLCIYDDTWSFKEKCYRILFQIFFKIRQKRKEAENES